MEDDLDRRSDSNCTTTLPRFQTTHRDRRCGNDAKDRLDENKGSAWCAQSGGNLQSVYPLNPHPKNPIIN